MVTIDINTNRELQRIAWACHQHWRGQPVAVEERGVCHSWVNRVHRVRFGTTFSPQKLAILARLGVLTKDDTSRGGNRRYYRLVDPNGLAAWLARWSLN